MARGDERTVRLFVDADGPLTDLLSQLNIETIKMVNDPVTGQPRGFAFVEITDIAVYEAIAATIHKQVSSKSETPQLKRQNIGSLTGSTKHRKTRSAELVSSSADEYGVSPNLLAHAVQTFGSARAARSWLSSECGALHNQTPLNVIQAGNGAEVERVLDCIDYGMFA